MSMEPSDQGSAGAPALSAGSHNDADENAAPVDFADGGEGVVAPGPPPEDALAQRLAALLGPSIGSAPAAPVAAEGASERDIDASISSPVTGSGAGDSACAGAGGPVPDPAEVATRADKELTPEHDQVRTRAQNLISRELLDELSHESPGWKEAPSGSQPSPHVGVGTPRNGPSATGGPEASRSEFRGSRTPSPSECRAPEVPPRVAPRVAPRAQQEQSYHHSSYQMPVGMATSGGYEATWNMQQDSSMMSSPSSIEESIQLAQLRAQYDQKVKTVTKELEDMQERLKRVEIERAQVLATQSAERRNLMRQLTNCRSTLMNNGLLDDYDDNGYSGTAYTDGTAYAENSYANNAYTDNSYGSYDGYGSYASGQSQQMSNSQWGYSEGTSRGAQKKTSLDSKMQQLNALLQEPASSTGSRSSKASGKPYGRSAGKGYDSKGYDAKGYDGKGYDGKGYDGKGYDGKGCDAKGKGYDGKGYDKNYDGKGYDNRSLDSKNYESGATWHQQSRSQPAAAPPTPPKPPPPPAVGPPERPIRRPPASSNGGDADQDTGPLKDDNGEDIVSTLREMFPNCTIRECEVPDKETEAVVSSTGRRPAAEAVQQQEVDKLGGREIGAATWLGGTPIEEDDDEVVDDTADYQTNHTAKAGSEIEAPQTAPISSLHGMQNSSDHWTSARVDKAASRGFEARRQGRHWEFKISMGGKKDPPMTEAGMDKYCRWLSSRFQSFSDENGPDAFRGCRTSVDFSHSGMNNQMVWMLLETLVQHDVNAVLLKLFGNSISQGGVLAICEFIRTNHRAASVQEIHLSHNEVDDDAALELLRTLNSQRPRYPPERVNEKTGDKVPVPVWLQLNRNKIRDPQKVLRNARAEGVTVCEAWDRQACGTNRCCNRGVCPLVHLYNFGAQDVCAPVARGERERAEGEDRDVRGARARPPPPPPDPRQKARESREYIPETWGTQGAGSSSGGADWWKRGGRDVGSRKAYVP